jgi:hypothetical protein
MGDFKQVLPKWFGSGKMFWQKICSESLWVTDYTIVLDYGNECSKSIWTTEYTIVSYYGTSWVGWDAVLSSPIIGCTEALCSALATSQHRLKVELVKSRWPPVPPRRAKGVLKEKKTNKQKVTPIRHQNTKTR